MKLAEKIIKAHKSTEIVESKSQEIIKELMATGFGGDNENQMKAVQLLKGIATSDEEESNAFMAKLDKALKGMSEDFGIDTEEFEFVNEELRKDLKYRFKKDKDGKFDLQFQSKTTGSWIHVRSFADKAEGQKYLKDNMEK